MCRLPASSLLLLNAAFLLSACAQGAAIAGEEQGAIDSDAGRDAGTDGAPCEASEDGSEQRRERFEAELVPAGGECKSEQQVRQCEAGTWSAWSGTFAAESCRVAASCGDKVHGSIEQRERYEAATVPPGSTCNGETQSRSCVDGTWTDWSGSFASETCVVGEKESCDGQAHGTMQTRTRYAAATVATGATCQSEQQTRTCNDGTWGAWSGTYAAESCRVRKSCTDTTVTPNVTVNDGASQQRTRYADAFPTGACNPEVQTRACTDGTFGTWSGTFTNLGCATLPGSGSGGSCRTVTNGVPSCSEGALALACLSPSVSDANRACPTGGTVIGKCVVALGVGGTYFVYAESAANEKADCEAITTAVWSDL